MEHQEKWQPQIDRYLRHLMSEEEKNVFMEEVNKNSNLANELALQQDLLAGVRTLGNRSLKSKLKNMHGHVIEKKTQSTNKTRRLIIWTISAAASMLLLFFIFKQTSPATLNSSELFAQYYQPYELNDQSRNGEEEIKLLEANTLYKQKKYGDAAAIFSLLLEQNPNRNNIQLAIGICHLEMSQKSAALKFFKNIQTAKDPFLSDRAQWYEAMTYLRFDDLSKCSEVLALILLDTNHDYFKEAQELSNALKE